MASRRAAIALAGAWLAGYATAQPAQPPSFAAALSRGAPFAFGVYGVSKTGKGYDSAIPDRIGAGFVIDADGHAVTAAHVIADCDRVVVRMPDQRVVLAQKIGTDEESDIALIRLPLSRPALPVFGRTVALQTGDWVIAIGEPYGLNRSVAAGIVAGKDRHFVEETEVLFIQSDIALNPGNSGGRCWT